MSRTAFLATFLYGVLAAAAALVSVRAAAASVSVCESASLAGNAGKEMYGPEGRLVTLSVSDAPVAHEACATAELPVPAGAVRWFSLTELSVVDAPARLGLQGYFDESEARVSEVIYAQPEVPGEAGFLPFNVDLHPFLQARSFGREERAAIDGRRLTCAAGTEAAGVVLAAAALWEQLPGSALELTASGNGEFTLALEDAARAREERPLHLGTVQPGGEPATMDFAVPENAERWTRIVMLCPNTAARLELAALKLVLPQQAPTDAGRATWLWSPQLWLDAPATAWAIARRENLRKFYVTVPLSATAEVANAAQLAAFIREAGVRGIEVWAVAGDRSDVLPENRATVVARAAAYRAFNARHPDARLAGYQLDIEPYLLPGIALAPDYWRARYIDTITAVHRELAGQLPLDLVMPVWWGTHPAWGSRLLAALALPGLSVTVMNYRTNADALRAGAMPFLAWGQEHGVKVAMALEQGRIGVNAGDGRDETRIDYAAADARGTLWLLELGGVSALLLLDADYAGLPGKAYAQQSERVISTGTISFAGAPTNLAAIAATLEAEWSAWDAFGGLAIHGLDQVDGEGR